jgi:hypothetical protein
MPPVARYRQPRGAFRTRAAHVASRSRRLVPRRMERRGAVALPDTSGTDSAAAHAT